MIFDITPEHIAQLDDTRLRLLIGYLAEQELSRSGHSTAAVTYGGHQNAPDGGIDVRVDLQSWAVDSYVPRAQTGYQVKAEDFAPQAIIKEMRPNGTIRSAIAQLAATKGAYIIVASKGAASDTALAARRSAMREAVSDLTGNDGLHLDFYDGRRIASWVNENPGIAAWVRDQLGQSLSGWRAFTDWSSSPDEQDGTYLADDHLRVRGSLVGDEGLSVVDGINRLRVLLAQDKSAVRIVGLSGVGKTRLIQALFDDRVGENALNRHTAIYTDMGNNPDPVPLELLARLQAHGRPCILIIDNCGIELHGKLVASQRMSPAPVNIITVEYDISDETPEHTNVFRLEAASAATIEKMIQRRYPALSQPEADAVAKFSEGNFRIALALAQTAKTGEPLTTLNDAELFKRLFRQKNEDNPALLAAAKVCALVYSFDTETLDGDQAELPLLADLARQNVDELYGHVSELLRRQLIQKRNEWRAVLPHAVAHRLAKLALADIPPARVLGTFENAPERLIKSFSRRLGYLHDVPQARVIVDAWLGPNGLLAEIENFNALGFTLLRNVAPVSVEAALSAIEQAWERSAGFLQLNDSNRRELFSLLRHLAYEPSQFDRAVRLIARLAADAGDSNNTGDAVNVFKSLFFIYLSGTMAGPQLRAALIRQLASTGNEGDTKLVLSALDAMLEVSHFSSSHGFEFGGLRRNFGYEPRSTDMILEWYRTAIDLCRELADFPHLRVSVRKMVASQFGFLVNRTGLVDEMVALADGFQNDGGWPEGWAGVRNALRQFASNASEDDLAKLRDLEERLAPQDLAERISVYLRPQSWNALDIVEADFDDEEKYERARVKADEICVEIGRDLAINVELLSTHMPSLIACESHRLGLTVAAIGEHATDIDSAWNIVRDAWVAARKDAHWLIPPQFVEGVRKSNPAAFEQILDEALGDERLHDCFVAMQARAAPDDKAIARIKRALTIPTIPTRTFTQLSYGVDWREECSDELAPIIRAVANRDDGLDIAIEMVRAQVDDCLRTKVPIADSIKLLGRELLAEIDFSKRNDRNADGHRLARLAKHCIEGDQDDAIVRTICVNLMEALKSYKAYPADYAELLDALSGKCPRAVLNLIVEGTWDDETLRFAISETRIERLDPIRSIGTETLLTWAKEKPHPRYLALAYVIPIWLTGNSSAMPGPNFEERLDITGWTDVAKRLFREAPDPVSVLDILFGRFSPNSWSGSRSAIMSSRTPLIEELCSDDDAVVSGWAKSVLPKFLSCIEHERDWEAKRDRDRDERFEW